MHSRSQSLEELEQVGWLHNWCFVLRGCFGIGVGECPSTCSHSYAGGSLPEGSGYSLCPHAQDKDASPSSCQEREL